MACSSGVQKTGSLRQSRKRYSAANDVTIDRTIMKASMFVSPGAQRAKVPFGFPMLLI
jgi:hypothetical protein